MQAIPLLFNNKCTKAKQTRHLKNTTTQDFNN